MEEARKVTLIDRMAGGQDGLHDVRASSILSSYNSKQMVGKGSR